MAKNYPNGVWYFNVTKAGRLHLFTKDAVRYRHRDRKPLAQMTGEIARTPLENVVLRRSHYNNGEGIHKTAREALAEAGIIRLDQLIKSDVDFDIVRGSHCSEFNRIYQDVRGSLLDYCPAIQNSDYVPPTIIPLNINTVTVDGLPDGLDWNDFDTRTRTGIRDAIKAFVAENAADLIRDALVKYRQDEIARLQAELHTNRLRLEELIK